MEPLCVVVDAQSEDGKRLFHDVLAAYSIGQNIEITIKWLKAAVTEDEVRSACTDAQIAFVNASDPVRATMIGNAVCVQNSHCALVYYDFSLPEGTQALVQYFSRLIPARPIRYLLQPTRSECYQTVSQLHRNAARQKLFEWETKGLKYRIPFESILYFRSERNHIFLHLKNGSEYSFLGKLSSVEQMVPNCCFVRVHQSYLVSRSSILLVDKQKKSVRLCNGEDIYISKAHYKETLEI